MKFKQQTIQNIFFGVTGIFAIIIFSAFLITQYAISDTNGELLLLLNSIKNLLFLPTVLSYGYMIFKIQDLLNVKSFFKLILGYAIVNFIYYFLLITSNINNPNFHITNFDEYVYVDFKAIVIIISIVFLSWLLNRFIDYKKHYNKSKSLDEDFQIAILLLIVIVEKTQFSKAILDSVSEFFSEKNNFLYIFHYFFNITLSIVSLLFVIYISLKALESISKNKPTASLALSISLLLAVIFNYFIQEPLSIKELLLDRYIFPAATLFQIIILSVFFLLSYIIFNRFLIASFLNILIGIILVTANSLKFSMRNEPLLVTDLIWIKQIDVILGFVNSSILIYSIIGVFITIVLYLMLYKRILVGRIYKSKSSRLFHLLTILSFICFINLIYSNISDAKVKDGVPVLSKVNNWYDINWLGFSKNATYKSLAYVWVKQLTNPIMDKPRGYDSDKIEKIAQKYENRATQINKERTKNIEDTTLIYILSESFSDPSRVDGVNLSQDVIPKIKSIKEITTSGLMQSDGYGGGTANMEFQTLTSLPLYNFSSTVSTIYTEVVPKLNIFPSISDQYPPRNRIVIHPQNGANYMRDSVYKKLNFEKFYSLANTDNILQNISYLGANVSDESLYQTVLDKIKHNNEEQFFSVITMQNHVPWRLEEPVQISGIGQNFSDLENDELSNYARLINATDNATYDFLNELSKMDKDITVVFYGDHLPSLYPEKSFAKNKKSQYQTDYFIWNNKENQKLTYPLVNSSDFSAEVLKHTNSKVSPYYALMTDVLDHSSIDKKVITQEQKIIAEDLRLIQYDLTEGKGYLKNYKSFFSVKE